MRICAQCQHVRHDGGPNLHAYHCGALNLEKSRCPITGREGYAQTNDLVGGYFTENPHPPCLKINTDGECPKWEQAP